MSDGPATIKAQKTPTWSVWLLSRGCDGSESLLTRRVPDLQLHPLALDVHCPDLKVNADGGDVAACRRANTLSQTLENIWRAGLMAADTKSQKTMMKRKWFPVAELTREGVVGEAEQKAALPHIWQRYRLHQIRRRSGSECDQTGTRPHAGGLTILNDGLGTHVWRRNKYKPV